MYIAHVSACNIQPCVNKWITNIFICKPILDNQWNCEHITKNMRLLHMCPFCVCTCCVGGLFVPYFQTIATKCTLKSEWTTKNYHNLVRSVGYTLASNLRRKTAKFIL